MTEHPCPHCGTPLPEGASFCPHCAKEVEERKPARKAIPLRRKILVALLVLVVVAAGLVGWRMADQPDVYDGQGGVTYGDYQLVLGYPDARFTPLPERYQQSAPGERYRFPSLLFINDAATGEDAKAAFSQEMEGITAQLLESTGGDLEITCSEPAPNDYNTDAIVMSFVDFTGSGTSQMMWAITMKNGDTIHLRQDIIVEPIPVHDYHYQDYPMGTTEQLQALLEQIRSEVGEADIVNIYLPPVTYTGQLRLDRQGYNFYGCTDGEQRTTFTDTVQVVENGWWICFFYDMDFIGDGDGIGVSASGNTRLTGCNLSGWDTAVLAYGSAWVNVIECDVRDNKIGFHFNSEGNSANHSLYNDNVFENNGTAVLLESVPTDMRLQFPGTVFRGNGTDINNRCGQNLNTEETIFED